MLDAEFAASLEPMNRLVHIHEDVEPGRVHELLRTRLDDFDRFAAELPEYLDRSERSS